MPPTAPFPLPLLLLLSPLVVLAASPSPSPFPLVVNTWAGPFTVATDAAFLALAGNSSSSSDPSSDPFSLSAATAIDAVHAGCTACEAARCDGTVGPGGSPDEACETTLDALLIDGRTLNVGAVAGLRRVAAAATVARHVLELTGHSLLVGDQATAYAVRHGLAEENLSSAESRAACDAWRARGCLPNFRAGVVPDPDDPECAAAAPRAHDTLSLIAIDARGNIAAGTTTNGAAHKIPGRAGDAAIPGSGAYADSDVGACGATGDGDIMMRFLPCYQAVESMRRGMAPRDAARDAVARMAARYPGVRAGLVVVSRDGVHAGAACGWEFQYAWRGGGMERAEVVVVEALRLGEGEGGGEEGRVKDL
ncbi:putative isoaspartyl peptidase/L-asparaginase 3 [Escovopsis weberi]|uniref:Putative isoaspartyl peptidase/L-asparaginase 3 n=1 Tax=Escovopsis weberi TaxID=150374 RepID=A0A0M9VWV8_ESCWE|nr:putative isoaspartyl peptidase/L-asparaginase 3 [Escovopsis weberi]